MQGSDGRFLAGQLKRVPTGVNMICESMLLGVAVTTVTTRLEVVPTEGRHKPRERSGKSLLGDIDVGGREVHANGHRASPRREFSRLRFDQR
jgi:hypothetical protein